MEALYRKYRPSTFADVAGQEHIKQTLLTQLATGRTAHAYLFTGPRGTGKTTVARLLAKAVNCLALKEGDPCNVCAACVDVSGGSSLDVFEIDAASHTDVDNVRENIIKSVRVLPNKLAKRVYIIDEVHMLSTASFNALLKTLEEPPSHALFILATTEIHKVPATIISRCQRFDFRRIPADQMIARLKEVVGKEGANVDEDVLRAIARHAEGCERDAESMLGQVLALGETHVTWEVASLVLPATSSVLIADFLEALVKKDAASAIRLINGYSEQGVDLAHFSDEVIETLRGFLFWKIGGPAAAPSFETALGDRLSAAAVDASPSRLAQMVHRLLEARRGMKTDRIPQLGLELAVVELAYGAAVVPSSDPVRPFPVRPDLKGRPDPVLETPRSVLPLSVEGTPAALTVTLAPPPVDAMTLAEVRNLPPEAPVPVAVSADKAVEVKAVVFDGVPVVDLDEIKRKWPDVFQQLKSVNASLPLVVQAGEITGNDGNVLEFTFKYELHANVINQDKNRRLLEDLLFKVLGKRMRVRGTYAKEEQEADAAVDDVLSAFGGTAM